MKRALKIISMVSIIIFGILLIVSKFNVLNEFNSVEFRNVLVIISMYTSLKYHQMEVNDKNSEIQDLKLKLENEIKKSNESV